MNGSDDGSNDPPEQGSTSAPSQQVPSATAPTANQRLVTESPAPDDEASPKAPGPTSQMQRAPTDVPHKRPGLESGPAPQQQPAQASSKGWWARFKDRYGDYVYPTLEPLSEVQKRNDKSRVEQETIDLDARIADFDVGALGMLQTEFKALLSGEAERRASVDSRLSTIMGLTSVVASITFGALTFRAGTGFQYPQNWAVWVAAAITLYIVLQLICAIQAALTGVGVRGSAAVNYDDTIPRLQEEKHAHAKRVLHRYLKCLHDQQKNNDARVSQLMVAHVALRNFLFGVAVLTVAVIAATLIPSSKEKDIVKELRSEPALYDALRGPKGDPGPQGPPGKDGKDGKNGKDGRDGKDAKDAGRSGSAAP